jgi:undecaprenyl-diphosphatase
VSVIGLACLPPAIAGYLFEQTIERRLGTPETIVAGLLAGSVAMALADHRPQERHVRDAGVRDGLLLGLAQAAALIPGVSRSGATLSAARLLGFARGDARRLSTRVGLPVLAGATLLKGFRLCRRGLGPGWSAVFAVGAAGSFASTFAFARRSRPPERLLPYAAYRVGLAGCLLIRLRRGSTARRR